MLYNETSFLKQGAIFCANPLTSPFPSSTSCLTPNWPNSKHFILQKIYFALVLWTRRRYHFCFLWIHYYATVLSMFSSYCSISNWGQQWPWIVGKHILLEYSEIIEDRILLTIHYANFCVFWQHTIVFQVWPQIADQLPFCCSQNVFCHSTWKL